ncbi:TetR/AcrR family transcriptional regulator [Streptosporangium sp. NPDC006013]|uniref:TetR/AcrR family transcriptional regulator n=1 Tax=Streptosporangium sp. NPDC006013 TaxID=3155596 RepID=UPI0033BF4E59
MADASSAPEGATPSTEEAQTDGTDGGGAAARSRRRRRPDRAVTEAALRQAALRLLDRDGVLTGLSLQDVADEAGVNRGLIHHYFGSRRTLVRSALDHEMVELAKKAGDQSAVNPMHRGARSFRTLASESRLAEIVMLLALDRDEQLHPIPYYEEVMEILRAEQEAGVWHDDVDVQALLAVWVSLLFGYLMLREPMARQMGMPVKSLDARTLTTIGRLFDPLLEAEK